MFSDPSTKKNARHEISKIVNKKKKKKRKKNNILSLIFIEIYDFGKVILWLIYTFFSKF